MAFLAYLKELIKQVIFYSCLYSTPTTKGRIYIELGKECKSKLNSVGTFKYAAGGGGQEIVQRILLG